MPIRTSLPTTRTTGNSIAEHISDHNALHAFANAGGGSPLLLVAASNAPQSLIDRANYICDGTADQVEINAALAVSGAGGVALSPGTFNLAAGQSIVDPGSRPITLLGSGWNTIIAVPNASNVYAISLTNSWKPGGYIGHFKIDGNGANQSTGGGCIDAVGTVWWSFEHLWLYKPWGNGLRLYQDGVSGYGHHNGVDHCFFDLGNVSNGGDGRGLRLESSDENYVAHNTFQDNGRAAATEPNHVYDLAGLNFFHHNSFVSGRTGLKLQGPDSLADGNIFDGCQDHHIRVNGARCQVLNNKFYNIGYTGTNIDGLFVDNVSDTQILDNLFNTIATGAANGGTARSAINLSSGPATNALIGQNRILATGMAYGTGAIVPGAGTGHVYRDNKGWTTENKGTATVVSGTTSISPSHGLNVTPGLADIKVTPTNDPTTTVRWWVSAVSSTTFTITTNVSPGASGATYAWQAQVV